MSGVVLKANGTQDRLADIRRRFEGAGWLWWICLAGGGLIHLVTAALRLNSLVPRPQALDYASYYAAAWAMRLGASPYRWTADVLAFLAETQQMKVTPPPLNSPPLWPWLLQPLTRLSFPVSSVVWLLVLLVVAGICHVLLVRLAGYSGWRVTLATLPITLSFGPLFLNLTLGQNGVFLLLAALLGGHALARRSTRLDLLFSAFWTVAVAAKLFPLLWIASLPLLRRWRHLAVSGVLCLIAFGAVALLEPDASTEYWVRFLPGQAVGFASEVGIDDQSLGGFLGRIGRAHRFAFPGLDLESRHEIVWDLPWELSTDVIGYLTVAILGLLLYWLWQCWVRGGGFPAGLWYALVLFSLLPFPHMERYNHVLALPAMAWLWRRGSPHRHVSVAAYGLFGLSRLNHLWAVVFPSPWGPMATGFGLFGVLALLVAVAHVMGLPAGPHERARRPADGSGGVGRNILHPRVFRPVRNLPPVTCNHLAMVALREEVRSMASHPINLALRFLVELAALAAYAYWGWVAHEGAWRYVPGDRPAPAGRHPLGHLSRPQRPGQRAGARPRTGAATAGGGVLCRRRGAAGGGQSPAGRGPWRPGGAPLCGVVRSGAVATEGLMAANRGSAKPASASRRALGSHSDTVAAPSAVEGAWSLCCMTPPVTLWPPSCLSGCSESRWLFASICSTPLCHVQSKVT